MNWPDTITIQELFEQYVDMNAAVSKQFLKQLYPYLDHPNETKEVRDLVMNKELFTSYSQVYIRRKGRSELVYNHWRMPPLLAFLTHAFGFTSLHSAPHSAPSLFYCILLPHVPSRYDMDLLRRMV